MEFGQQFRNFRESWVLLHAPKLGHGTDCFTSPPKEGMPWIFPTGKIRRLQSGANPRSWVPEASMLTTRPPKPLVHGNCKVTVVHTATAVRTAQTAQTRCETVNWVYCAQDCI
jgi:hypothetical protein